MRKLDSMLIRAQLKANTLKEAVVEKATEKQNGDTQVVVALILIVVAVGLCILFRQEINDILKTVSDRVGAVINDLAAGDFSYGNPEASTQG